MTPDFLVKINENDSTEIIRKRLISISTNDEAGFKSDSCEIVLDDFDDAIALPQSGAKIEISLGYKETEIIKIGDYFLKEVSVEGPRQVMHIRAHAINNSLRSQVSDSFAGTIGELVNKIATSQGLKPAVAQEFANIKLDNIEQFGESNLNLLTRIASQHGAVAKPSNGFLVFAPDMSASSVSGLALPSHTIYIGDVSNYKCEFRECESYGSVVAKWYDKKNATYKEVKVGDGEPVYEIKETANDEESAKKAAEAKLKRIQKESLSFNFSTRGRPELFAESAIFISGFKKKIQTNWIITHVQHSLNSGGFTTSVTCSNKIDKED
jgi:phage protein D